MEMKDIEAFITLAKKEGVSSLRYESKDIKISVTLPNYSSITSAPYSQPMVNLAGHQEAFRTGLPKNKEDPNVHKITSPFVGTFYTSASPGEPSYVKIGDKIKKGQVLCIVEAMKIMNEIDCDVAGEVLEICVENESLVEYGQVLFLIKV